MVSRDILFPSSEITRRPVSTKASGSKFYNHKLTPEPSKAGGGTWMATKMVSLYLNHLTPDFGKCFGFRVDIDICSILEQ